LEKKKEKHSKHILTQHLCHMKTSIFLKTLMNKTLIVHPNFRELGEEISQKNEMNFPQVQFENFPDSWPNLFIQDVKDTIEHHDVTYI